MFFIYCHTNKQNGKRYVGWTSKTMELRWRDHLAQARQGSRALFHKAIRKYGAGDETWEHQVLESVATIVEAKLAEQRWIRELRTHAHSVDHHGYNHTLGGDGVAGKKDTEETRQRKGEAQRRRHKTKPVPFETRQAARSKHPPLGQESRAKMSRAKQKPVAQCDFDGNVLRVWDSPCFVEGFSGQYVARAARGLMSSYKGFVWKYV